MRLNTYVHTQLTLATQNQLSPTDALTPVRYAIYAQLQHQLHLTSMFIEGIFDNVDMSERDIAAVQEILCQ